MNKTLLEQVEEFIAKAPEELEKLLKDSKFDEYQNIGPSTVNLLYKARFYLIGAIEAEKDCGRSWRKYIQDELVDLNINWFDPCNKHFLKDVQEVGEHQVNLKKLRETGQYDELAKHMREIRIYDLSMVDRSDAIIFYYDSNTPTCGTWEEFFWAIRLKRSIFVIAKNGLNTIPLWMFGCLPHKYFYDSIDKVIQVLKDIDNGTIKIDSDRWRLLHPQYR
jgi:hypothetical protein